MTDWEKFLERRKANIGFMTRGKAFRHPTPGEMESSLAKEIKSWQDSKGKLNYKISAPYDIPKGKGINLLATRELGEPITGHEREKAIEAYINTDMDEKGILKSQNIDVSVYERRPNIFNRIYDWFIKKTGPDYERGARLTKEFIDSFNIKEKK
jgi:hypothetical protein